MSPYRPAALVLLSLLACSCNNSTPGSGPLTHSTALPSVQGGYTGSTAGLGGGTVTFTVVGARVDGTITLTFANDYSTPPATFACSGDFTDFYDTATRTVSFTTSEFITDPGTTWSSQNDYDGVITINPDRTFTVVLHLASDQYWNPGGGFVDHIWDFPSIVYSGQHDPGT